MAFVPAATSNTLLTTSSGFFNSNVHLISGTDYYVDANSSSTLYLNNASSKLALITEIYSGQFAPRGPQYATYIDFDLFPNLARIFAEGTYMRGDLDLRYNQYLTNLTMWAGNYYGNLTAVRIAGVFNRNINYIDLRQGNLVTFNISGCQFSNGLNMSDGSLSALEFKGGQIPNVYAGQNQLQVKDFSLCDTQFLSALRTFTISRWNSVSYSNRKLNSFNLTGPLSSIEILSLANNNLTAVNIPNFPTLKYLYLGGRGYSGEIAPYDPQYTLSANNITLDGLSGLYYLDISGLGSLSALSAIKGIASLSSLRALNVSNSPDLVDLNFAEIPSSTRLYNLQIQSCPSLTSIYFSNVHLDNDPAPPISLPNSYLTLAGCSNLSSVDLTPLTGLGDLYLNGCSKLTNVIYPNNGTGSLFLDGNPDAAINLSSPNNFNKVYFLSFTNLPSLTSLNITYLQNLQQLYLSNIPKLSSFDFSGLSALNWLRFYTMGSASAPYDLNLQRLSAMQIIDIQFNPGLTALNTNLTYNSLRTVNLTVNANLSSAVTFNSPSLKYFNSSTNRNVPRYNLNNNPSLHTVRIAGTTSSSPANRHSLSAISLVNNPSLSGLTLSNQHYYLSAIDLTNTNFLSAVSIGLTSLTALPPQINTKNLVSLSVTQNKLNEVNLPQATNLTSLICNNNSITSLDISNFNSLVTVYAYANKLSSFVDCNSSNLDTLYLHDNQLKQLTINSHPNLTQCYANSNQLTGVNFNAQSQDYVTLYLYDNQISQINLNSASFEYLHLSNNQLSALNLSNIQNINFLYCNNNPLTAITLHQNISSVYDLQVQNCQLSSKAIDSLYLQLSADPTNFGLSFYYTGNPQGRTAYTDSAYTTLISNAAFITPDEPPGSVPRATPEINIINVPATLGYLQTAVTRVSAYYFSTNDIPVYASVLSGPGVMVATNTLSALSGSGTVTLLLSSASTSIFVPVTAQTTVALQKLDISNAIFFDPPAPNYIYNGTVQTVTAYAAAYGGLTFNTYYLQGNTQVLPISTGTYTVSAVVTNDNFTGSATTTLTIYPSGYYELTPESVSTIIYASSGFDTTKDVVVTFDYACHGDQQQAGEGFCVSFLGYTAQTAGGAPGPGLNYTNATFISANALNEADFINYAGLSGGILGVGFDINGNFGLQGFNTQGYSSSVANSITIRDAFFKAYQTLYRTPTLSAFAEPFTIYQYITAGAPEFKRVRVRIANLGRQVIVQHKKPDQEKFHTYANYALTKALPRYVKPCLSFSSSVSATKMMIKNFNVNGFYLNDVGTSDPGLNLDTSLIGPGPIGLSGVTLTTDGSQDVLSYNGLSALTIPETMNLYIGTQLVANVLFDPIYANEVFTYYRAPINYTYVNYFTAGDLVL